MVASAACEMQQKVVANMHGLPVTRKCHNVSLKWCLCVGSPGHFMTAEYVRLWTLHRMVQPA
jgi:hypothetical protein